MSWLRLDSQMVIRRSYFALGGGFVIVVAIALAVALRPAPLTGDVAADAACAALASAAIKDGQLSPATRGESVSDPGRLVRDQFGSRSRVRTARWSLPGMSCTVKVSALMPSVASTWSI
jgi:hypothetical protein